MHSTVSNFITENQEKKMVFASHAFFASAPLQMNPNILGFFERKNVKLCIKNTGIFASIVPKQVCKKLLYNEC